MGVWCSFMFSFNYIYLFCIFQEFLTNTCYSSLSRTVMGFSVHFFLHLIFCNFKRTLDQRRYACAQSTTHLFFLNKKETLCSKESVYKSFSLLCVKRTCFGLNLKLPPKALGNCFEFWRTFAELVLAGKGKPSSSVGHFRDVPTSAFGHVFWFLSESCEQGTTSLNCCYGAVAALPFLPHGDWMCSRTKINVPFLRIVSAGHFVTTRKVSNIVVKEMIKHGLDFR